MPSMRPRSKNAFKHTSEGINEIREYFTAYGNYYISNYGKVILKSTQRILATYTVGKVTRIKLTIRGYQKSYNVQKLVTELFPPELINFNCAGEGN